VKGNEALACTDHREAGGVVGERSWDESLKLIVPERAHGDLFAQGNTRRGGGDTLDWHHRELVSQKM